MAGESYYRGLQSAALEEQNRVANNPFSGMFDTIKQAGTQVLKSQLEKAMNAEEDAFNRRIKLAQGGYAEEEAIKTHPLAKDPVFQQIADAELPLKVPGEKGTYKRLPDIEKRYEEYKKREILSQQVPVPGAKPEMKGPYASPEQAAQVPTESIQQSILMKEPRKQAQDFQMEERKQKGEEDKLDIERKKLGVMKTRADAYLKSLQNKGKKGPSPAQSNKMKVAWEELKGTDYTFGEARQYLLDKGLNPTDPYFKDLLGTFGEKKGRTKISASAPSTDEDESAIAPGMSQSAEDLLKWASEGD